MRIDGPHAEKIEKGHYKTGPKMESTEKETLGNDPAKKS